MYFILQSTGQSHLHYRNIGGEWSNTEIISFNVEAVLRDGFKVESCDQCNHSSLITDGKGIAHQLVSA